VKAAALPGGWQDDGEFRHEFKDTAGQIPATGPLTNFDTRHSPRYGANSRFCCGPDHSKWKTR
jgi:hypothetical protein